MRQIPSLATHECHPTPLQVTHISRVGGSLQIRKEDVRAAVFKPTVALPTMSVEEFGEIELERARLQQVRYEEAERTVVPFSTRGGVVMRGMKLRVGESNCMGNYGATFVTSCSVQETRKDPPSTRRRYDQLVMDGDEDDAELVEQAAQYDRAWDDWKAENPRGSGNKANKII